MDEIPLVSIVIPAYNARQYVAQTVDSCLAQTYTNCEIIVVDDGSVDGTGDMLRKRYGDRIQVITQKNQGVSAARNTGTRAAQGDFIGYCDADDILLPAKIERNVQALLSHPDAGLVYSHCDFVEEDGQTLIPRSHPLLPSGDVFCELLIGKHGDFVASPTPLIRRQAVLDVGEFNEALPPCEDWDFWLRLAARYPFIFLDEVLAHYRVRANAAHTNRLAMAKGRLRVIQLARHYGPVCLDDAAYDALEAGRYHVLAMVHWEEGDRKEARKAFREAIRLAPSESTSRRLLWALTYIFSAGQSIRLIEKCRQLVR